MKPFSILHISDLHRSPNSQISNSELISALIADRKRYRCEEPKITAPEAIVICGDIIQGVPLGISDYDTQLTQQYEVAEQFLDELTNRFLDGDRSRLVIVPGNHDIDWNTANKAFEIVVHDSIIDISSKLNSAQSDYRLDLKTLTLLRIRNRDQYALRLEAFWKFYNKFYSGVSGLLRVQSHSDFSLFSLNDGRIGLAAFNSCINNDCYAFHGLIKQEAIAQSHLSLLDIRPTFDLHIAAWHHSIEGPPYRTDYMDVDIVRGMIGRGFRIGLYGHQHKSQITPHQIWLPNRERMAVISAGSLCADTKELPSGIKRQYNILEISPNFCGVRVHVRSMDVANLFSKCILNEFGGTSFVDLDWEPRKNPLGGIYDTETAHLRRVVEEAEIATKSGNHEYAVKLLRNIKLTDGSYGRQLLITSAIKAKDWQTVIDETTTPLSIEELTQRVEAFIKMREYINAEEAIDSFSKDKQLPENIAKELRKRIIIEEAMN